MTEYLAIRCRVNMVLANGLAVAVQDIDGDEVGLIVPLSDCMRWPTDEERTAINAAHKGEPVTPRFADVDALSGSPESRTP